MMKTSHRYVHHCPVAPVIPGQALQKAGDAHYMQTLVMRVPRAKEPSDKEWRPLPTGVPNYDKRAKNKTPSMADTFTASGNWTAPITGQMQPLTSKRYGNGPVGSSPVCPSMHFQHGTKCSMAH
jgi:hypothetical protein